MGGKKLFVIFGLFLILFSGSTRVDAHELLPKPILEYLEAHPDATVPEIQAYAETQSPDIAQKFKDKDAVLQILRNRNSNFFDNFWDFTKLGINHILSGPDHILFVITLVLVFVSIQQILKFTGTFTVAHSITLILAGTGIFTLPSRFVEPMIALSIGYVAVTSVFLSHKKFFGQHNKIALVFFFGLFHGLGFAGLLKEIQIPANRFVSSLLAFNVGIELGQLIILALILPPILFYKDRPWYPKFIKVVAVIIATVALFWIIERIFFV